MLEKNTNETVTVPETVVTEVSKEIVKWRKETVNFTVNLQTREVRSDRLVRGFDADGNEVLARVEHPQPFDFAEIMSKGHGGVTGAQVYAFIRTELDERDPL